MPMLRATADSAGAGVPAVRAERLSKARGDHAWALTGLTFHIAPGEFFGLVGPRGAGKTALVRLMATIVPPDAGRLTVLGFDARADARQIRRRIGYVSQALGLDERLTGRENLILIARLHSLKKQEAGQRADEMLARLDLSTLADCKLALYPPGARKRLAIACGLVHRPRLLLLDDPTGGVQPQDQGPIWHCLRTAQLREGLTIVLATHHLEEVESICQRVAIIDGGKIIASGTPAELKAQVAGATVTVRLAPGGRSSAAALLLERFGGVNAVWPHPDRLELEVTSASIVPMLLRVLEEHEIPVRDITLSKPSLDEVFFRHTGRKMRDSQPQSTVGTSMSGHR